MLQSGGKDVRNDLKMIPDAQRVGDLKDQANDQQASSNSLLVRLPYLTGYANTCIIYQAHGTPYLPMAQSIKKLFTGENRIKPYISVENRILSGEGLTGDGGRLTHDRGCWVKVR